jgi:hypothetical protein
LKKHGDANHGMIGKKLEEEINNLMKKQLEKQPTKKRPNG